MKILVFGYRRDQIPSDATIVDCRVLYDPERLPGFRALTGDMAIVQAHVRSTVGFGRLWPAVAALLDSMPDDATIAFGCAWGKHRSRAVAHIARDYLASRGRPAGEIAPYVWKSQGSDR